MGNIMGINVIYVLFNMVVNNDCMFKKKLSQISVPPMTGHLQCRGTLLLGWTGVPTRQVLLYIYMFPEHKSEFLCLGCVIYQDPFLFCFHSLIWFGRQIEDYE